MTRERIVNIALIAILVAQYIRTEDSVTAFGVGGFVGLVLGIVLGAAWVAGEPLHIRREEDATDTGPENPPSFLLPKRGQQE